MPGPGSRHAISPAWPRPDGGPLARACFVFFDLQVIVEKTEWGCDYT